MTIDFMEAVFGAEKEISLKKKIVCEKCSGSGAEPGAKIEECNPASITFTSKYGEIAPPPPPRPVSLGKDGSILTFNGATGATWTTLSVSQMGGLCVNQGQERFIPGTEQEVALKLVPGPDGELYLNINGQWKKVLTTV